MDGDWGPCLHKPRSGFKLMFHARDGEDVLSDVLVSVLKCSYVWVQGHRAPVARIL